MTSRRLRRGDKLVLASHNAGKLAEFQALFAPTGVELISAAALNLPEPDETANHFEGNALIKGLAAASATGMPALADDSGFCVSALGGRPGVHSARWGGPTRDFNMAMQRVHNEMAHEVDTRAAFVAVLGLVWPDGTAHFVEGRCEGHVAWPPRGEHGHGYDPIFVPEGEIRTFAELSGTEKNAISHRGRALTTFITRYIDRDG